jgi:hypothetical protein
MKIFIFFLFYFGLLNYSFSQEQKIANVKFEGKVYRGFMVNENKPKDFILKTLNGDMLFFEYNRIDTLYYSNEVYIQELKPTTFKGINTKKSELNYTIGFSFFPHFFKIKYDENMTYGNSFATSSDKKRFSTPFINLGFQFKENQTLSVSLGYSIYSFNNRITKPALSYDRNFRISIVQLTIIDRCFIREYKGYNFGIIGGLMVSLPKINVINFNQYNGYYNDKFQLLNGHLVVGSYIERIFKKKSIVYIEPTICFPINFVSQEIEFRFKSLLWGCRFGLNIPLKFN